MITQVLLNTGGCKGTLHSEMGGVDYLYHSQELKQVFLPQKSVRIKL